MLVARHRHGHEANYGFFIANSTEAVLRWHERLVRWALSPRYEDRVDQKVWWFALVGENPETCGRDCGSYTRAGAAGQLLHPPGAESMRFNKIPYEDLPHPHRKLKRSGPTARSHCTSGACTRASRSNGARPREGAGYLFVEEPPAAYDRLPH